MRSHYTAPYREAQLHLGNPGSQIKSLEIWEINPEFRPLLERNLPQATIRITDSFVEMRKAKNTFDLIVIDNPLQLYGPEGRLCEHFDLFPDILRLLKDQGLLIFTVYPFGPVWYRKKYPMFLNETHLKRRQEFYGTEHPENIPIAEMMAVYERLLRQNGFKLNWCFSRRRKGPFLHKVVLGMKTPATYVTLGVCRA